MLHILVATRSLRLYIIEVCDEELRLVQSIRMPGWIQWIIGPQRNSSLVTCISRGGDIVRLSFDGSKLARRKTLTLSALPTAAMQFGERSLLLGTTTGLLLVDDDHPEGIVVPVTRSAVLSFAHAKMRDGQHIHNYVTMGLEDGRLRVVDAPLLHALARGTRPRSPHDHNLALELHSAVLAVETVQLGAESGANSRMGSKPVPSDTAYVLAVLRDHSVRLFQVISEHAQREAIQQRWTAYLSDRVARAAQPAAGELLDGLRVASEQAPADWRDSWNYMLVDVVLPRLCALALNGASEPRRQIVDLACKIAQRADRRVLSRLSRALREITSDVDMQLRLSRAILREVPHHDDRRWEAFIDGHLRELHALARTASNDDDRTRLVAWARFVRKFVRRGNTFTSKRSGLLELVKQNEDAGKPFDALVYLARLSQRRYDLRWERSIPADIAEIHTVDFDSQHASHTIGRSSRRAVVVVVTVDAKLMFLDGSSGCLLTLEPDSSESDHPPIAVVGPFLKNGAARTLASAAVTTDTGLRIVLSATGAKLKPPGLEVLDIDALWETAIPTLRVKQSVGSVVLPSDVKHAFIHALRPLPGRIDAFIVGLATRDRPVGLLRLEGRTWMLETATDTPEYDRRETQQATVSSDPSSFAPGKIPTRALAIAAVDEEMSRYLVVAGSDDGLVRAISFARDMPVGQWQVHRWDQVADAVTCAALGRYAEKRADLFACYLGTVAGDVFAVSILPRGEASTSGGEQFADYEAQPLWRESHEGPVLAMQLWSAPMYRMDNGTSDKILVVVTEKGRLCLYQHSHRGKQRLAVSSNYYYRGMRFDRISMASRLKALTMVDDDHEFVAAGPAGQIYKGALLYLRESDSERAGPTSTIREPSAPSRQQPYHELGHALWAYQERLFESSTLHEQFSRNEVPAHELKLALCDLVRLEGGALSAYALRRRFWFHEQWDREDLTGTDLRREAQRRLRSLRPENPEDAEQIKVILKSLCRTFLYRDLNELRIEILGGVSSPDEWNAKTAAACKVVGDYLTREVGYATTAAARLRIVAIKELLCVPVLRHIACAPDLETRQTLTSALAACLRDDDRLVRIEALRSISVMLRNVGVMAETPGTDRERFIGALFPRGLGSVTWLLDLLVGGLRRFPGFTRQTALVSGAWYLIKALLPLFRIFDHRTLALCEHLLREGVDVEVLALCLRSLRGLNTDPIRYRIEYFYFPTSSKDAFIDNYYYEREKLWRPLNLASPDTSLEDLSTTSWYQDDDTTIAHRLSHLLGQLAVMWKVISPHELGSIKNHQVATKELLSSALENVVAELVVLAEELTMRPSAGQERLATLRAKYKENHNRALIQGPLQNIVLGILDVWDRCTDSTPYSIPLAHGTRIHGYELGELVAENSFVALFNLKAPDKQPGTLLIRVLRRKQAAKDFLELARRNSELAERSDHIAKIVTIHEGPPPAYVMPNYEVLEDYLNPAKKAHDRNGQPFHDRADASLWVEQVAMHIAAALHKAHARDWSHGDVTAANILFSGDSETRQFCLRDFGMTRTFEYPGESSRTRGGLAPVDLSKKGSRICGDGGKPWDDIVALLLILYEMLTGQTVNLYKLESPRHLTNIDTLIRNERFKNCRKILHVLYRLFDHGQDWFDVSKLIDWIAPAPEFSQPVAIILVPVNTLFHTDLTLDEDKKRIEEELPDKLRHFYQFQRHGKREPLERLTEQIKKQKATIVHIRGRGANRDKPIDLGSEGPIVAREASAIERALANGVVEKNTRVRCVLLSACFSSKLAKSIAAFIDVVIWISPEIMEPCAGVFAGVFYAKLAEGASVKDAFDASRAAIGVAPPVELFTHGVDPATLRLLIR